jgi:carbamoyltransferase
VNVLSFSELSCFHDTSAALVCDGVLVAAAEEERFSRRKHDGRFPARAIDFCLDRGGIRVDQVDVIAFPMRPFRTGRHSQMACAEYALVRRLCEDGAFRRRSLVHKRALDLYLRLALPFDLDLGIHPLQAQAFTDFQRRYGVLPTIRYYDHHLGHAAAAYLTSGFETTCVLTADGRGGMYSAAAWQGAEGRLERVRGEPYTNSLGRFYTQCTAYLGLGEFGEGKLMGLAPYGDRAAAAERVRRLLEPEGDDWYRHRGPPAPDVVGFPPRDGEPILQPRYTDFAAGCQDALERAVARAVGWSLRATRSTTLCLGGGVMLNCSSNGALRASGVAADVWNFPAAGDAGLTVGAALLCAAEAGELRRARLDTAYLGPEFDRSACEAAVRAERRVSYRDTRDLAEEVAQLLASGHVLGWFQGRMEFGPRALGHRSILADPRTAEMRDRVNRVKRREPWRPLAPVVRADRAAEFFELRGESPFMLFAAQVRPERRAQLAAIVHVDGSARPQTVTRAQDARLYDLLGAFERHAGVPVLLNTSFNDAGEPIVCTPDDALRTFLSTGLDVLVLGDFVVRKRP